MTGIEGKKSLNRQNDWQSIFLA